MTARLRRRRAKGDRGAVLVEAALVLPVLMVLLWGIIEFGFGWRDKITVETAARAGARTASSLGKSSLADYNALSTTVSALSTISAASIDYVVIFNATTNGITAGCTAGTASSTANFQCNVYLPSTFTLPSTSFGCGASAPDRFWCPTSRIVVQSTGPSYVGVYVKTHRALITTEFGSSIPTIQATAIMRLEPA